jgi:hypothetical protein
MQELMAGCSKMRLNPTFLFLEAHKQLQASETFALFLLNSSHDLLDAD